MRRGNVFYGLKSHSENGPKVVSVVQPRPKFVGKKCWQFTTDYKLTNVL